MSPNYAGVDGCRDGWFCVFLDHDDDWGYALAADANGLVALIRQVATALIDIPIGLLDKGSDERCCDIEARRVLARPRSSSVFPVPARPTLEANDYLAAGNINRRVTGRGLSRQSWALLAKIRDVDDLLNDHPDLRGVLRECHPEICFQMLNHGAPMLRNKKQAQGREERLKVLQRFFPAADRLFEDAARRYLRRQVALDDIIDAMVAAVTAKCGHGTYKTLPVKPMTDSCGHPMEIVYWESV